MAFAFLHQIQWRHSLSMGSTLRQFCRIHYGSEFEVVHLYACSTAAQDANLYRVWAIPEPFAAVGPEAYTYLGLLPEVLADLYGGEAGILPADLVYPEVLVPASELVGWAWMFKTYNDHLDVYQQWFSQFDTPNYAHFRINVGELELWYAGAKTYVGQKTFGAYVMGGSRWRRS